MPIKLPEVDRTKLHLSYKFGNMARELTKLAEQCVDRSRQFHREHYDEQYDRCRACDGRGNIGEGLLIQRCRYCNCGLLPKGTLKKEKKEVFYDW